MTIRFPLSLATSLTVLALAACTPPSGLTSSPPAASPTPSASPSAIPSPASSADPGDSARRLTGSITLHAGVPGSSLIVGLNQFEGATWKTLDSATGSTDAAGSFAFEGLTAGTYQVVWKGPETDLVDAAVDPLALYVSKGLVLTETDEATLSFDVGWAFNPSIKPDGIFMQGETFDFTPLGHVPDAEYQIVVADLNKQLLWSSAWGSATSFNWSGRTGTETNSPGGPTINDFSVCHYMIKFRKAGSTFGGNGPYGQTKWVRFGFRLLKLEL